MTFTHFNQTSKRKAFNHQLFETLWVSGSESPRSSTSGGICTPIVRFGRVACPRGLRPRGAAAQSAELLPCAAAGAGRDASAARLAKAEACRFGWCLGGCWVLFWVVLGGFGWFWVVLGGLGWFGWFWVVLGGFGWFGWPWTWFQNLG